MKKAITLTQADIDNNPIVSGKNVGDIYVVNTLPRKWNGWDNYNSPNHSDVQFADGWRDVIEPNITVHQRYGQIFLSGTPPNDFYTYPVEDFTAQEIIDFDNLQAKNAKLEIIGQGVTVSEGGNDYFFTYEDWVKFSTFQSANTGNMKWYDTNNVLQDLNGGEQISILTNVHIGFKAIMDL